MKFWELISIFAQEERALNLVLNRPGWSQIAEWYRMYGTHVENQNRAVLDAEVPDELCREALAMSHRRYVIRNGQLTTCTPKDDAMSRQVFSPVDAFNRFGGTALEEVAEKGSYIIP